MQSLPATAPADATRSSHASVPEGGIASTAPSGSVVAFPRPSARGMFSPRKSGVPGSSPFPSLVVDPVRRRSESDGPLPGGRPPSVSEEVWSKVAPSDRAEVVRRAGRHFLKGLPPDEAVALASRQVEEEFWAGRSREAAWARLLAPDFPPGCEAAVRSAARAVGRDAEREWRTILESPEPSRTAFRTRSWHASPGTCLLCCAPVDASAPVFGGDALHRECLPAMSTAGPAFSRAVVEAAEAIARETTAASREPFREPPSLVSAETA